MRIIRASFAALVLCAAVLAGGLVALVTAGSASAAPVTTPKSPTTTIRRTSTTVARSTTVPSTTVAATTSTSAPDAADPVSTPTTVAGGVGDASSSRKVNLAIGLLVGLGVLVAGLTIWFWTRTKPLPPALEALDTMSRRRWRRADPERQAQSLDNVHAKVGDGR